ncbi:hypothetical protein C8T65DRAFT_699207 [Cerioporus squamosus]|nr:hypothetical protein C8T65DRAFT_699207 [Cerioporus squamosus]
MPSGMEHKPTVRFAPFARVHTSDGAGLEPVAEGSSPQSALTTLGSRRNIYQASSEALTSFPRSATGTQGNTYRSPSIEAVDENVHIHHLLLRGLSQVDLRTNERFDQYRDTIAFPQGQHQRVRLRLTVLNTTVCRFMADSKSTKALSVRDVVQDIKDALKMPIEGGILSPGHPLYTTVAAALARRRGHVPRNMDLYGPADRLVLVGLVPRADAHGLYFDVDVRPFSYSRV